ncbi:MAG: hypothetical protein ACJ74Z_22225 [Bryobacteraceae bacterium]|jgi:hypothetical protein
MNTFRDLHVSHCRHTANYKTTFFAALRNETGNVVWCCDHDHRSRTDAEECADAVRHCDEGSLMEEELQQAMRMNQW